MAVDEAVKRQENNDIIDHLEAVRRIVERKCSRCNGMCMGCLFSSLDVGMIPGMLDKMLDLMHLMPNDRSEIIQEAHLRHSEREEEWRRIFKGGEDKK